METVVGAAGNTHETIGHRLLRLRKAKGLSQRALSGPGISYAYVSRIEAGTRQPSVKAVRLLAAKLDVTPEYLETGSNLSSSDLRELRLADLELRLRLDQAAPTEELLDLLDQAVAASDARAAARARLALGLAASAAAEHGKAIEYLKEAVNSDGVTPLNRPDIFLALGQAYVSSGFPENAVGLFERALSELEATSPEDLAVRIRFGTYLSYALTDLGDIQRARQVVMELCGGTSPPDPYSRVRLYWSQGRIMLEQGDPLGALDTFRRAVALLEVTEDALHLGRAHIACADAALTGGSPGDEVEFHLDIAERLLAPAPAPDDLAVIRRLQAMCASQSGDYERAQELANEALALTAEFPNERGQSLWALAEAAAAIHDPAADDYFTEAITILAEHGTPRHHTGVLRAYARYLRDNGREKEALDIYDRIASALAPYQPDIRPVGR
jgi:tetratricopeptide (TPR) repeat protein